jgi:kynurenine formamidase
VTEDEVLDLFSSCSNHSRWGAEDQLGTLNLITPEIRLAALATVQSGDVVPLGAPLEVGTSRQRPPSARLEVWRAGTSALDTLTLTIHGYEATHLDALGHTFMDGRTWAAQPQDRVIAANGLLFASVEPAAAGIVTRGVLLDVAAVRGVPFLRPGEGIGVADMEHAERRAGVRVGSGDALFIRAGHAVRVERDGPHDEEGPHEGVLPEVLPWLRERDVAVYAGDCIELRPSGYERVPAPLHQIANVAMGLWILDCPDLERLAAACQSHGRSTFAVVIAPLRIRGGTGSAVNPLALF